MPFHRFISAFALAFLACAFPTSAAEDWPQWRGPQRSGISSETDWFHHWSSNASPRVAWRAQVGKGHAAISIAQGRVFATGWDGEQDTVCCFDALTGKVLWRQSYPCKGILQWPGPRATPTVEAGRVYTLSQHGLLCAWRAENGQALWRIQLPKTYQPDENYGFAWSPLIIGDLLLLGTGANGLAVRKETGAFAWGNDGLAGACASPVPFRREGQTGMAMLAMAKDRNTLKIVGVDAATGRKWFESDPWPEKWGAACADLVTDGASLFLSTAEQHKMGARFTLTDGRLRQDWANRNLSVYTSVPVLTAGHLFGVDKAGILKCLDWQTGAERWAQRGFDSRGALIAAGDKLIVQAGAGNALVVAAAAADRYHELRRLKPFQGDPVTFTAPVLSHNRLYLRSYAGEVVCLDLTQ